MTVTAVAPIARYTGNGLVTVYAYTWVMGEDSSIDVLVDNFAVVDYTLQGANVVFNTAPVDGAEIIIFRRTKLWMPEDYKEFGRFPGDKTEKSMDRIVMIMQELMGDALPGEVPNGLVGGANLFMTRGEFDITVNSERGTDATILMWDSDTPSDSTIIWAGERLTVQRTTTSNIAFSSILFYNTAVGGPSGQSNAQYNFGPPEFAGWVDHENPAPGGYWMRITQTTAPSVIVSGQSFVIKDGTGALKSLGDEFDPINAELRMSTTWAVAPAKSYIEVYVDICLDDGGSPDGNWATRTVYIELDYTL